MLVVEISSRLVSGALSLRGAVFCRLITGSAIFDLLSGIRDYFLVSGPSALPMGIGALLCRLRAPICGSERFSSIFGRFSPLGVLTENTQILKVVRADGQ